MYFALVTTWKMERRSKPPCKWKIHVKAFITVGGKVRNLKLQAQIRVETEDSKCMNQ